MYPINTKTLKITSKFGSRSYQYQGKTINDFHTGIDLVPNPFDSNSEVIAFEGGIVVETQKIGSQYGVPCYVKIKHENGYYTLYYHLKSNSIVVNNGDFVHKGQKLGIIGTTGQSTGVHLHFQIDKGNAGSAVDPYDYVFNDKKLITTLPKDTNYIVSEGDTLSLIAKKYEITWQELYNLNKDVIDNEAKRRGYKNNFYNYIFPNQKLILPNSNIDITSKFMIGDTVIPLKLVNVNNIPLKQYDEKYTITKLDNNRATLSATRDGKEVIWATLLLENIKKIDS